MIATLPMYDLPWLRPANDLLWSRLARRLRDRGIEGVPDTLHRGGDLAADWTAPALLLAQTCGYPLVTRLQGSVQIVATPHYAADGCEGASHRSAIVVRRDDPAERLADLRGRRAGVNGADSNTGMNLLRAAVATVAEGAPFFAAVRTTGSHGRSLAALLSGRIDVAAIDAVTLALLSDRHPHHGDRVRVLAWSAPSPALPLITAAGTPAPVVAALREELAALIADPASRAALRPLRITGFSILTQEDYAILLTYAGQAAAQGYPVLA